MIPVDQYGMSFQLRTTKGTTKWMALNAESLRVFNEVLVPALPDRGNIRDKWLDEIKNLTVSGGGPAELVAKIMKLLDGQDEPL